MSSHPKIAGVATVVPANQVSQSEAKEFARKLFGRKFSDLEKLLSVFDNAAIEKRYFTKPLDWFDKSRTLSEKNAEYLESSSNLSFQVAGDLLESTGTAPDEIDYIIYVNTTGLATPSIDARLINKLGLRSDIRRTPIWGLGCAGGAAGLSHAYHHLLGHPKQKVLLVACELCGLTFMRDDYSKSNLVATALFGEGAAAVLLTGSEFDQAGVEITATNSRFYRDSLNVMGWNILDEGLQVIFAKRIPEIIEQHACADLTAFLHNNNLDWSDIAHYIFHPGGMKVIEAYQKALNLTNGRLILSADVLKNYGNMSSVTVLFVLKEYLSRIGHNDGGYALVTSLGPGFCSESLLLRQ